MSKTYVLFYSNYCGHCKTLIQEIQQTPPIMQTINFVCVDTMPRQQIPNFLQNVPTLMLNSTTPPLVGERVFGWLQQQKQQLLQSHSQLQQQPPPQLQSQNGQNGMVGGGDESILAWHHSEMGSGWSNSYCLLGSDCSAEGTGGNDICGSFAYINSSMSQPQSQQSQSQQLPMPMSMSENSQMNGEMQSRYSQLKMERDRLFSGPSPQQQQQPNGGMNRGGGGLPPPIVSSNAEGKRNDTAMQERFSQLKSERDAVFQMPSNQPPMPPQFSSQQQPSPQQWAGGWG